MPLQNISSCTHGVTTITGVKSVSVTTRDTLESVHIDGDSFNSYVNFEAGGGDVVVTSTDLEQLQALDGAAAADLVVVVAGVDGTADCTITAENCIGHSFKKNTPEPGGLTTASLTFSFRGDTGAADGIAFA